MKNKYWKGIQNNKVEKAKGGLTIQLIHEDQILITGQLSETKNQKSQACIQRQNIIKKFEGSWDKQKRGYVCSMTHYQDIVQQVNTDNFLKMKIQINYLKQLLKTKIEINQIPEFVYRAISSIGQSLTFQIDKVKVEHVYQKQDGKTLEDVPKEYLNKLFDFQKEGVKFGLLNKCRVLIADEMGVGKTIQAICLSSCFLKPLNKLLILCPSSLKYYWEEELIRWNINKIPRQQIQVFAKSSEEIYKQTRILICSYDIIESNIEKVKKFQPFIAIGDEAHYLKNSETKRAKTIIPILQSIKHVILLTGTPAFARPKEMFTLLQILRPDVFTNFKEYGDRYCNPSWSQFHRGFDYQGSTNDKELHFMLTQNIMIRRLKKDVLNQLPLKKRRKIVVNVDQKILNQISQILHTSIKLLSKMQGNQNSEDPINDVNNKWSSHFQTLKVCYQLSGISKLKEVKDYLGDLIEKEKKIIVFAEHQDVLNSLEQFVKNELKLQFIRIDGSVLPQERHKRVQQFQNEINTQIALLSYGAASQGLSLTASSNILFAEMHWTPAIMQQAEDRAHRIGQSNPVVCHYILGKGTLDDMLYAKIEEKLKVVGNILDGQVGNLRIDEIRNNEGQILQVIDKYEIQQNKNKQNNNQEKEKSKDIQNKDKQNDIQIHNEIQQNKNKQNNNQDQEKFQDIQNNDKSDDIQIDDLSIQIKQKPEEIKQKNFNNQEKQINQGKQQKPIKDENKINQQHNNKAVQSNLLKYYQKKQNTDSDVKQNKQSDIQIERMEIEKIQEPKNEKQIQKEQNIIQIENKEQLRDSQKLDNSEDIDDIEEIMLIQNLIKKFGDEKKIQNQQNIDKKVIEINSQMQTQDSIIEIKQMQCINVNKVSRNIGKNKKEVIQKEKKRVIRTREEFEKDNQNIIKNELRYVGKRLIPLKQTIFSNNQIKSKSKPKQYKQIIEID